MVDSSKCFSLIRGRMMRVTRLDACGNRVLGPTSVVTSKGFITVGLSPQTEDGTTISVVNAAGDVCIQDDPPPKFTGYDIEVAFCGVNPDLVNIMTNNPIVTDSQTTPQGVGFRVNSGTSLVATGFALEVWSAVPAGACDSSGLPSYGYFLVPFAQGGIIGDISIGNDAVNFTLTGASSKDGSNWGVGFNNVRLNNTGAPTTLKTAIDPKDHLHLELVQVPPPTDNCGATALGVIATGITMVAGANATTTPTNSYAPATLAALISASPTKTPTTAWTTGSYVLLGDGSKAYWNATTWVAGVAP